MCALSGALCIRPEGLVKSVVLPGEGRRCRKEAEASKSLRLKGVEEPVDAAWANKFGSERTKRFVSPERKTKR